MYILYIIRMYNNNIYNIHIYVIQTYYTYINIDVYIHIYKYMHNNYN